MTISQAVLQSREEIRQLDEIGQQFDAVIAKADRTRGDDGVKRIADPLARLLSRGLPATRLWATLYVLERPSTRHLLRVRLLRRLTHMGIYRDLTDLPDVGACAISSMLARAVGPQTEEARTILDHVSRSLRTGKVRMPTTADATLLAMMVSRDSLEAIRKLTIDGEPLADLLKLAFWLRSVEKKGEAARAPDSPLARQWFETLAYRGVRRRLARLRGRAAGPTRVRTLPEWLMPPWPRCPEGFGAMIVEWTLAFLRAWPEREQAIREDREEIIDRAKEFQTRVETLLQSCDESSELVEWLRSGVRGLMQNRSPVRRLHRNRAQNQVPRL